MNLQLRPAINQEDCLLNLNFELLRLKRRNSTLHGKTSTFKFLPFRTNTAVKVIKNHLKSSKYAKVIKITSAL